METFFSQHSSPLFRRPLVSPEFRVFFIPSAPFFPPLPSLAPLQTLKSSTMISFCSSDKSCPPGVCVGHITGPLTPSLRPTCVTASSTSAIALTPSAVHYFFASPFPPNDPYLSLLTPTSPFFIHLRTIFFSIPQICPRLEPKSPSPASLLSSLPHPPPSGILHTVFISFPPPVFSQSTYPAPCPLMIFPRPFTKFPPSLSSSLRF